MTKKAAEAMKRPSAVKRRRPAARMMAKGHRVDVQLHRLLSEEFPQLRFAQISAAIEQANASLVEVADETTVGQASAAFSICFQLTNNEDRVSQLAKNIRANNAANVRVLHSDWKLASESIAIRAHDVRGNTLVALRSFQAGEQIFRESPLILWSPRGDCGLSDMFWASPPHVQYRILGLFAGDTFPDGTVTYLDPDKHLRHMMLRLEKISFYNGLPLSTAEIPSWKFEGSQLFGMFWFLCRMSHSCRPTAEFRTISDNGAQVITCLSRIRAGEELTISYLKDSELTLPTTRRQRWLQDIFGFSCECERCQSE